MRAFLTVVGKCAGILLAVALGMVLGIVGTARVLMAPQIIEPPVLQQRTLNRLPDTPKFIFDKWLCLQWSRDLTHWSRPAVMMEQCDTPQLGWIGDKLFVFFIFGVYDGSRLGSQIGRSEISSSAGGYQIAQPSIVDIIGQHLGGEVDPSILKLPSGGYRLYYTLPAPPRMSQVQDPAFMFDRIASAFSPDGIHWKADRGYRVEDHGIVDPEVVVTPGGRYRLYYTLGADRLVHSAISSDSLDFTLEPGTRVDGGVSSTIRLPSGKYLMVYQGAHQPPRLEASVSVDAFFYRSLADFQVSNPAGDLIRQESPSLAHMPDGNWVLIYMLAPAPPLPPPLPPLPGPGAKGSPPPVTPSGEPP